MVAKNLLGSSISKSGWSLKVFQHYLTMYCISKYLHLNLDGQQYLGLSVTILCASLMLKLKLMRITNVSRSTRITSHGNWQMTTDDWQVMLNDWHPIQMIDSILDVINLWSKCEKHVTEFNLTHIEHVEYLIVVIWHMKFFFTRSRH